MIVEIAKKVLPVKVKRMLGNFSSKMENFRKNRQLINLRSRLMSPKSLSSGIVQVLDCTIRINDRQNFYILYKDIFMNRIYHFEATRSNPLIIDCGSNIGMSILY